MDIAAEGELSGNESQSCMNPWSRVHPDVHNVDRMSVVVISWCSWNDDFTNSADHLNMIKILSLQTKYSVSSSAVIAIWLHWKLHNANRTECQSTSSIMAAIHQIIPCMHQFGYTCHTWHPVHWTSRVSMIHSVHLCSFQCSQMAMTADDETEYFVCSDKILIIFKWSAELVKSSFQLHMTITTTLIRSTLCTSWVHSWSWIHAALRLVSR